MTFIATIAPDAAEGVTEEMYRRHQASWGFVPNYARAFGHRPEVMLRWMELLGEIRRPMGTRRYELVTFAAAHTLGNSACALAHGQQLKPFFADEQILAIASGRLDGVLDAAEQAMVRFARQVAKDASRVTEADVAALAEHGFGDAEIFDIAATASARAFFTKMLDSLGVLADAAMGAQLRPSVRRALTVGRPIDERPPVALPAATPVTEGPAGARDGR